MAFDPKGAHFYTPPTTRRAASAATTIDMPRGDPVDDFDYTPFEDEPAPRKPRQSGLQLPGGISLQAAAAILLVAVSLAALFLIFGPSSDEGEVVGPATNTPIALGVAAGRTPSPAAVGVSTVPVAVVATATGSVPLVGTTAGTPTALAPVVEMPAGSAPLTGGPLAVDGFARVIGTDAYGLRLRFGAGLDTATIRWAEEGETMRVVGGPLSEDGETWWRVQDALGNTGWAAATYLAAAATPPSWAPPIASPTHDPASVDLEPEADLGGVDDTGASAP